MPGSKLITATIAELVAPRVGLPVAKVREVLREFDQVVDAGLQAGNEVEIGSMGYLSLREAKNVQTLGEVRRGRRVAFREKDANRERWK